MLVHWVASIFGYEMLVHWECDRQGLDVGLLDTLARRTRKVALRSWGWEFSGINMYHDNGWWQPEILKETTRWGKGSLGSHYLLKVLYTIQPVVGGLGFLNHQQYQPLGQQPPRRKAHRLRPQVDEGGKWDPKACVVRILRSPGYLG